MSAFIYWTTPLGASKTLWFDVTTEESHVLQSEVTMNPVEQGIQISDHVRPLADDLKLTVYVSNTPIVTRGEVASHIGRPEATLVGANAGAVESVPLDVQLYEQTFSPTPGGVTTAISGALKGLISSPKDFKASVLKFRSVNDNVGDVLRTLRELRNTPTFLTVVTSTHTYKDMILVEAQLTRSAVFGSSAGINLSLKQVRVVRTKTTNVLELKQTVAATPIIKPTVDKGKQSPTKLSSGLYKGAKALGAFK